MVVTVLPLGAASPGTQRVPPQQWAGGTAQKPLPGMLSALGGFLSLLLRLTLLLVLQNHFEDFPLCLI